MMKIPKSKNGKQRPYKPDFVYPAPGGTGYIFHEHFGVDQTGRAPDFLGSAYEQRVRQKRQIFRTLTAAGCNIRSDCVSFFETLSGDFASGTVFTRLGQQLRTAGIEVGPEDEELKEKALAEFRKSGDVEHLFLRFVQTFRSSGLTEREVRTRGEQCGDVRRAHIFLDLAFRLCAEVEHEYARNGFIEFSDMIRGGTAALLKNENGSPYRLILVDEFQDIVRSRMDFVEALVQSTSGTAVLFCVGDDWQAINRFAGSTSVFSTRFILADAARMHPAQSLESRFNTSPTHFDVVRDWRMSRERSCSKIAVRSISPCCRKPHVRLLAQFASWGMNRTDWLELAPSNPSYGELRACVQQNPRGYLCSRATKTSRLLPRGLSKKRLPDQRKLKKWADDI
jgi:UvrD/REP helicase N-terminal domain